MLKPLVGGSLQSPPTPMMEGLFKVHTLEILALSLCLFAPAAWGQTAPNPHWDASACAACHTITGRQPVPISSDKITPLCLSCHNGARASSEAHPTGRVFDFQKMSNPGWPLPGGMVQCQTCHDARQACDPDSSGPPDTNAVFLRPTTQPFCSTCHRPAASAKLNPHLMVVAGRIVEAKCLICHRKLMDNTLMSRHGDPALRDDVVTLCRSCHPHHKDILQADHILIPITPDMLVYMRAREMTGLLGAPSADLLQQLTQEKARPIYMIPDPQGRVVC
ncbi:MAG TPA: hypothetical protein VMD30_12445, partial [Tepidisphaeraceae bacterium]|nr:hypothetical protein [Tepidisphaeraceae bacterium]